jgi:type IX secretion system PorP/SprF family membrane protein
MRRLIFIFLIISSYTYAQHNVLYSQYYFSGILINPAYAGSQNALNLTSIYRNQWTGIEGAPKNLSIGIHSPLKNDKVNLGLIFLNNKFGITCESRAMAVYAYKLKLGKGALSFGLQGGVEYYKNDLTQIRSTDNGDPVFEPSVEKKIHGIFGAGIFYKSENMIAGLSVPILYSTRKDYSISYSPVILSTGFLCKMNDNIVIKPAGLVRYIKNSPVEGDISAAVYYKEVIGLGVGYRSNEAVYGYLDLKLNEQFSVGYCYDYTLSSLNLYSNGSHEFMLRYIFSYKLNTKSPRYF